MKANRTIPVLQKSHAPNEERIGFFQSFCSTTHASPSARFTVTLFVPPHFLHIARKGQRANPAHKQKARQ